MGERIDKFCEDLRVKLTNIDNGMQALKSKIDSQAQTAEQDVRTHLDGVKKRMDQNQAKVTAAQADMKKWLDERKAATDAKVAEWRAKREKATLESWADGAERYSAAVLVVASAAVDEAEQAALEAWLARRYADAAQGAKAA